MQVVVKSLPYAICDQGGMGCVESSAMKIALVCVLPGLKFSVSGEIPEETRVLKTAFSLLPHMYTGI